MVRSVVTGGIVGAAVGVTMLMMKKARAREAGQMAGRALHSTERMERVQHGARSAAKMVRDNTMRWTSAMKNSTDTLSKRLTRRLT